jgi:hypothetical protein
MTHEQKFIIAVVNLLPDSSILYVQAPSLESPFFLDLFQESSLLYYRQLELTDINKKTFGDFLRSELIVSFFQSCEVRYYGKLLFRGYDGMEIGEISRSIDLPADFKRIFVDSETCVISAEW